MKKYILLLVLFLTGCATNVTTTKFTYTDPATGASVAVEMPKEINAEGMTVSMDAKNGTVNITATKWISQNQGTLTAEAAREVAVVHEIVSGVTTGLGTAGGAAIGSAAKSVIAPGIP